MIGIPTINQNELVNRIRANLESRPHESRFCHTKAILPTTEPAAYALILGAGFSYPIVPLVKQLMRETIGGYYYYDQDQSGDERPANALRKDSARFWSEFNKAAAKEELPIMQLDSKGLPENPGAAYQYLFTGQGANALFAVTEEKPKKLSFVEQLMQQRGDRLTPREQPEESAQLGKRFVNGFLRYTLDPGGEHGYGSTGRNELNLAHIYLAALLEVQQTGSRWSTCAFCRTIFTTNFDTLLQTALQEVRLLYRLTDRPERGLDPSDFQVEEGPIHLVYTHGSILRHNPASTIDELKDLETANAEVLRDYLNLRDVIAIGYGGWNDTLMAALRRCDSRQRTVYWCDISSQPANHVAPFLAERRGAGVYVQLGETGAGGLMHALYEALVPLAARTDRMRQYLEWWDSARKRNGRA